MNTNDLKLRSIGLDIPKDFKILGEEHGSLKIKRPDNLIIFLNERDSKVLNKMKIHCTNKDTVIQLTGIYRGLQIASNYSKRYTKDKKDYTTICFDMMIKKIMDKEIN